MKRLIYLFLAALLACAPGLCFGSAPQAIGEMVQIQPKVPAPSLPGNLMPTAGQPAARHTESSTSGPKIITVTKSHYQLPAKNAAVKQNEPDFTVYGDDSANEADSGSKSTVDQSPKAPAAPAKVKSAPSSVPKTPEAPAQSPPS